MKRWWVYQRERFPLLQHGPLVLAFSSCAVCYSSLLTGMGAGWGAFVVAFVTCLIFFLQLRIADEFKDAEEDAVYRPYRAVPRGLVSLRELGVVFVLGCVVQLGLAIWFSPWLVVVLLVGWGYLALMSVEFFACDWLKARPVTYLWTHMLIMPIVDFYATACHWLPAGEKPWGGLVLFLAASFCNGLVIELGRKLRQPSAEEEGVPTYSGLWGLRRASRVWLGCVFATFVLGVGAGWMIGFWLPVLVGLGLVFGWAVWRVMNYEDSFMIVDSKNFELLGGKAGALARLEGTGCVVPAWFAVSEEGEFDEDEVLRQADELGGEVFAVRSSARGEDGVEHSFAGQYATFLYVGRDDLLDRICDVWESGGSEHLTSYQDSKEIGEVHRPTAIVQVMVDPDVSGVSFSADPVSGRRDEVLVSGLWGVGSSLVSGDADADLWSVREKEIVKCEVAEKVRMHVADATAEEGVSLADVDVEKRDVACLDDAGVLAVAELARACEEHFGCPQDIEWAMADGILYLLQSRPITTLGYAGDPDAPLVVWDNSNIAESYSGVTSPLTFSFAERAYEHVYREFCGLLSVPKARIKANDFVFSKMLGHVRGRVYYNLNSWYHVLAMLPGFSMNRGFMEQMMGVKEPMPDEVVEGILKKTRTGKVRDAWGFVKMMCGLVRSHRKLGKQMENFYDRLNGALGGLKKPLTEMSGVELVEHYEDLESQLLKRWDAPLVNDFFAMIFYGVLKSLCEKWLYDASLQNHLLVDTGDIVSAEPPRRIKAMAEMIQDDGKLAKLLADGGVEAERKVKAIELREDLLVAYESYLEEFGDRCLEELKLESPTVGDDPQSLLTGVGVMALRGVKDDEVSEEPVRDVLGEAVEGLGGIKRRMFLWVLKHAKGRVRDRENLRFERTRLFGRVRKIVVELGKRLVDEGRLVEVGDVFYLKLSELMDGYRVDEDFKGVCEERKAMEADYGLAPPDRFETRGDVDLYEHFVSVGVEEEFDGEAVSGTGACPGVVRGPVRVVVDPRGATLKEGEILVAQQTDPGWVVLFPAAAGLLVERGSLLSHSAIVARELSLPCVVSIRGVTSRLKTGDVVEMNGSTGEVRIIE